MNSIPLLAIVPVGENKKLPFSQGDFYGHQTWRNSLFADVCATACHTFRNSTRHGWDQRGFVRVSLASFRNSPLESGHRVCLLLMLAQLGLCPIPNVLLRIEVGRMRRPPSKSSQSFFPHCCLGVRGVQNALAIKEHATHPQVWEGVPEEGGDAPPHHLDPILRYWIQWARNNQGLPCRCGQPEHFYLRDALELRALEYLLSGSEEGRFVPPLSLAHDRLRAALHQVTLLQISRVISEVAEVADSLYKVCPL